jgi:hypothetical protein
LPVHTYPQAQARTECGERSRNAVGTYGIVGVIDATAQVYRAAARQTLSGHDIQTDAPNGAWYRIGPIERPSDVDNDVNPGADAWAKRCRTRESEFV